MRRRNPVSRHQARAGYGPPGREEIECWRAEHLPRRGCPLGVAEAYVRALRRSGEWWGGVDLRTASDDQVIALKFRSLLHGLAVWRRPAPGAG